MQHYKDNSIKICQRYEKKDNRIEVEFTIKDELNITESLDTVLSIIEEIQQKHPNVKIGLVRAFGF